jgi:hypothetical protein
MHTRIALALFIVWLACSSVNRTSAQVAVPEALKGKLTPEQLQRFQQLTPEQKEKLRERMMQGKQPGGNPAPNPAAPKGLQPKGTPNKADAAKLDQERMEKLQEMLKQRDAANSIPPSSARVIELERTAKLVSSKKDADSKPLAQLPAVKPLDAARSINQQLTEELKLPSTSTKDLVDDQTFLRRVYLDIVGHSPSPEELTAFVLDSSMDKRTQVVEKLLAQADYGTNWARYWRDVIMYRKTEDRAQIAARPAQEFLTEQFNKNVGWDRIAEQFITASGEIIENGQTAIFMAQMGDTEDITAEVSRIFLGIQMQCAQCHDHPTDRWKREQFHELAAFFPRNTVRPGAMGDIQGYSLVSVNNEIRFRGPDNNRPRGNTEHYMPDLKDPTAKGTQMEPVFFITGKQLDHGTTDLERRNVAADWITGKENPWFARAFVNRLWSELTGEGFYEPVDDIGPDREATAPQTLDYLAAQFQANKYDIKWLFRTITATEAYQRVSKSRRNPDEPAFRYNVAQPLRADVLYTQLLKVLGAPDTSTPAGMAGGPRYALRDPRFQFNTAFGFDPSIRRDEVTSSIPQALALQNGQANGAINSRPGSVLDRLLRQNPKDQDALLELYLRCLSREPSQDEVQIALSHIKQSNSRGTAYEDLFWALINSAEFNHRR